MAKKLPVKPNSQILIYRSETGETKIEVRLQDETVWLTQRGMAELFQTSVPNINLHLGNIFDDGELDPGATIKDFLTVQTEGTREVTRKSKFYNLDAIISAGYRIKSKTATRFRQWATRQLREYLVKGFVLDDDRLKNPHQPFDYFDELLRRIQDIRTSERRFYQKITDIYATSIDYDPTEEKSIQFFKTVQNKMHWAVSGKTAAEIVYERANSTRPHMGLTSWRGDKVRKTDVSVAKNYLNEKELLTLNNLVEQYLIFAEGQAMRRIPMSMDDWIEKLHGFLQLNERDILDNAGKISHELAKERAEVEYDKFHKNRLKTYESDFDKMVKKIESGKKKHKGGNNA